ncbi:GNAT family N-acetyltransferase [Algiphilus sp.]|uniref:GNAT family N-acetyltransferase n=1 Tax=Algiphilus sp. TaxID=1872431 RepID=UPI0025C290B1|nr:GNAT family N-acetyltransferase [Algiphilus sp.]MCK5769217.1 GNAT family N-acetyltransferase [Algiphilus sp.]
MPWTQLSGIGEIDATEWDALFDPAYPFTRHAFLAALEDSGSVAPETGWEPAHIVVRDDAGTPIAAAPHYRKHHSYGEFVFDFEWARAAQRIGHDYYPKGLCAIPFTPSAGPRLGARDPTARAALGRALRAAAESEGLSSIHTLFALEADANALREAGFLERQDLQFRFANRGYADFDDYLAALSSARRKKIRRERRRVHEEAGIGFETVPGDTLDHATWERVYALYAHTYHLRGQPPYLTFDFWLRYGAVPGTPVRVVLARHEGRIVACALCVQGGDTLYGRHWGTEADYHSLHFETCYYQGIAYTIDQGLAAFDAGAQGGHKLLRGFEPVITRSMHWLSEPRLHDAVARFLERERAAVSQGRDELAAHSAYRRTAPEPGR